MAILNFYVNIFLSYLKSSISKFPIYLQAGDGRLGYPQDSPYHAIHVTLIKFCTKKNKNHYLKLA